jgi:hypothetical protein
MIPPRRGEQIADPTLLTGLLGAAAMLDRLRATLAELAADDDRCTPGGEAPDAEVVDVVLGLAALASLAARPRPDPHTSPEPSGGGGARRGPVDLVVEELLP